MMKKLILLTALAAPALAEPQLFVRNQPFAGPVRWIWARRSARMGGICRQASVIRPCRSSDTPMAEENRWTSEAETGHGTGHGSMSARR